MEKIVNLKEKQEFLEEYVNLRNNYVKALLTSKVTISDTLKWLANTDIELYGLVEEGILLGVVLIYLEKKGEVTFFVKTPGRGYGSKLLKVADQIAKKRHLPYLWAWTRKENLPAIRAFEKNGYEKQEIKIRNYQGEKIKGYVFVKQFKGG